MKTSRRGFAVLSAFVLLLGAHAPLASAGALSTVTGTTNTTAAAPSKIDAAFAAELSNQLVGRYFDVIVVLDKKESASKLQVFGRKVKTYRVLPMARILLNKDEIEQVAKWSEVRFIEPSRSQRLFNAEGRVMTGAEEVQRTLGLDGTGVTIAIIDTGADGMHPDLTNVVKNYEVIGALGTDPSQVYVSLTPNGIDVETSVFEHHAATGTAVNTDEYGHGTHCIGTIGGTGAASDGHLRGMAPKTTIISYGASVGINLPFTLEAYDHIIWSVQSGQSDIRVISNSWGSSTAENFNPNRSTNVASRMAFDVGVLSIFAAGNEGPGDNTLNPYAAAPYGLGIGATNKAYGITGFSSRGRRDGNHDRELALANLAAFLASTPEQQEAWDHAARPLGIDRPSIVAPGENIVSAQNPAHPMTTSLTNYGAASGTSMATPHVTGLASLIHQAQDQRGGPRLKPLDLVRLFEKSANKQVMYGYEAQEAGAGFADVRAALDLVNTGAIPSSVSTSDLVTFNPGPTQVVGGSYAGTAAINSYQTNTGYGLHKVTVQPGAIKLSADASWALQGENLYVTLYAPGVDPSTGKGFAAQSAGLTTVQNYRSVDVKFPAAGEWHVRIDGRVNLVATEYTGKWEVTVPENVPPSAELALSSTRVNNEPVTINARVADGNGVASVAEAVVRVVTANGKVIHTFDKSAFAQQGEALVLSKTVSFSGAAPWTVEVSAKDSAGLGAVKQVTAVRR